MIEKPLFMCGAYSCQVDDVKTEVPSNLIGKLLFPEELLNRHIGVEIEVEDCGPNDLRAFPELRGWHIEKDGSLRGPEAREFKSVFPSSCLRVLRNLELFFKVVESIRSAGQGDFNFSERTSIHVHVDVRDLTPSEIKSVLKLHMIFEKSLFDFSGRERYHNIFCVPVNETTLINRINPQQVAIGWEKYCSINLKPIYDFGSIEFRSMAGNDNLELIQHWVLMLASLVEFASRVPPEKVTETINTLKTESQYLRLAENIFGEYLAKNLTMFPEASDDAASLTKLV